MADSLLMPSCLPPTVALETTYHCNHRCVFCSCPWTASGNGYTTLPELTTTQYKDLLGRLVDAGVSNLSFTGGEPLTRADIRELITFAANLEASHVVADGRRLNLVKARPSIHINTNGVLIDDDFVSLCAGYGVEMTISLPGLKAYSRLTGGGNCAKALDAMSRAAEHGLHITAAITVTKWNLSELFETVATALLAGASQILLNRFLVGGRGLDYAEELCLTTAELRHALMETDEVLTHAGRFGSLGTEVPACIVDGLDLQNINVSTRCAAVSGFIAVDPSGYLRVCNHSPVRLCHYTDLDGVSSHQLWQSHARRRFHPTLCLGCDLIQGCDAGCRAAAYIAGDICGPDPSTISARPDIRGSQIHVGDMAPQTPYDRGCPT